MEVEFLGFNLCGSTISIKDYISRHRQKLPRVTGRRELQVALGSTNVLQSFVPNLSSMLGPYYDLLETTRQQKVNWKVIEEQFDRTWAEVLARSLTLCRKSVDTKNVHYTLCTNWSNSGVGFALYIREQVVWIGSKIKTNSGIERCHLSLAKWMPLFGHCTRAYGSCTRAE